MNTLQTKFGVQKTNPAAITTTQPSPFIFDSGLPISDYIWAALKWRINQSITLTGSSGTVIDRGGLLHLRDIKFETDKHGIMCQGLDGLCLEHLLAVRNKVRPVHTDITSGENATYTTEYELEIPFYDFESARPEDTGLDVLNARPTLTIQQGIGADIASTATVSIGSGVTNVRAQIDPKAGKTPADMPLLMPYLFVHREVISAAATQYKISLPCGDRIYKRIFLMQRSTTAPYAPLANTVLGATGTYTQGGDVSLHVNGFPWIDRVPFLALQNEYLLRYAHAAPTGVAVLDFCPRFSRGYKYADALNVMTPNNVMLDLFLDAAAPGTCAVWVMGECLKAIPAGAVRALPNQGA